MLSGSGENQCVLNANQITKPFLSNMDKEVMISKYMEAVFYEEDLDTLLHKIISNNSKMATTTAQILKQELL